MKKDPILARLCSGAGVGLMIWSVIKIEGTYKLLRSLAIESQEHPEALAKIQVMPETLGGHTWLLAVGLGLVLLPDIVAHYSGRRKSDGA